MSPAMLFIVLVSIVGVMSKPQLREADSVQAIRERIMKAPQELDHSKDTDAALLLQVRWFLIFLDP